MQGIFRKKNLEWSFQGKYDAIQNFNNNNNNFKHRK